MANFIIRKSQVNNIALTLSERSQLVNAHFLFEFIKKFSTSEVVRYASVQNQASVNIRFDLLVFNDTTDPDGLDGEIDLELGQWSYKVYESLEPTLDIEETTQRVLQKGLIIVTDGII